MKDVITESRCLKFLFRCMKAAFLKSNFQKFLMCLLIKRLSRASISKHSVEPLKHSSELLKHSAELLKVLREN